MSKRLILILIGLIILLVACRPDPKTNARQWADSFPKEIGMWQADEDYIELTAENQSSNGHITIEYEGDDDQLAYLMIDTYATETAADVAYNQRLRQWELEGVRFERERIKGEPIDIGTPTGGFLSIYQIEEVLLSFIVIPPSSEEAEESDNTSPSLPQFAPLPMTDIETMLEMMVEVADNR